MVSGQVAAAVLLTRWAAGMMPCREVVRGGRYVHIPALSHREGPVGTGRYVHIPAFSHNFLQGTCRCIAGGARITRHGSTANCPPPVGNRRHAMVTASFWQSCSPCTQINECKMQPLAWFMEARAELRALPSVGSEPSSSISDNAASRTCNHLLSCSCKVLHQPQGNLALSTCLCVVSGVQQRLAAKRTRVRMPTAIVCLFSVDGKG